MLTINSIALITEVATGEVDSLDSWGRWLVWSFSYCSRFFGGNEIGTMGIISIGLLVSAIEISGSELKLCTTALDP